MGDDSVKSSKFKEACAYTSLKGESFGLPIHPAFLFCAQEVPIFFLGPFYSMNEVAITFGMKSDTGHMYHFFHVSVSVSG